MTEIIVFSDDESFVQALPIGGRSSDVYGVPVGGIDSGGSAAAVGLLQINTWVKPNTSDNVQIELGLLDPATNFYSGGGIIISGPESGESAEQFVSWGRGGSPSEDLGGSFTAPIVPCWLRVTIFGISTTIDLFSGSGQPPFTGGAPDHTWEAGTHSVQPDGSMPYLYIGGLAGADPADTGASVGPYIWEYGPIAPELTITVSAKPNTIVANASSQSKVTATVTDADGNPVAGETVTFSADSATAGAAGGCGPTTDNGDGTYTCTYTSTIVSGDVKVTATDGSLTADCMIHQTPQAVGNMGFGPAKVGIVRQGRS